MFTVRPSIQFLTTINQEVRRPQPLASFLTMGAELGPYVLARKGPYTPSRLYDADPVHIKM
jgi:hypothetical protein